MITRRTQYFILFDSDTQSKDPVIQLTTPHPPPPPPPPGGVLIANSTIPDEQSKSHIGTLPGTNNSSDVEPHPEPPAPTFNSTLPHFTPTSTTAENHLPNATAPTQPRLQAVPTTAPGDRLAQKLEYARVAATANPYYLALGESVRARTAWIRDGRANVLVANNAAETFADGLAAHAAEPTITAAPPTPSRVPCSIIGTISMDQCFLRADGNFKGFNPALTWQKSFSQTTLSFALGPPPSVYPNLVNDFHTAIATFDSILPKNTTMKSGQYAPGFSTKHLRLRHAVFSVRVLVILLQKFYSPLPNIDPFRQ